jgi:hypothetical protein
MLSKAIKKLSGSYLATAEVQSIREINEGLCADFATEVCDNVPCTRVVGVYDMESLNHSKFIHSTAFLRAVEDDLIGHTCILYKGMFYDAEAAEGVQTFEELPCIQRTLPENNYEI